MVQCREPTHAFVTSLIKDCPAYHDLSAIERVLVEPRPSRNPLPVSEHSVFGM
jgi:hypothetical protein